MKDCKCGIHYSDNCYEVSICEITPLPPVDLTTGEMMTAEKPFFALLYKGDETDFVKIKFCPFCGKKLMEEKK